MSGDGVSKAKEYQTNLSILDLWEQSIDEAFAASEDAMNEMIERHKSARRS